MRNGIPDLSKVPGLNELVRRSEAAGVTRNEPPRPLSELAQQVATMSHQVRPADIQSEMGPDAQPVTPAQVAEIYLDVAARIELDGVQQQSGAGGGSGEMFERDLRALLSVTGREADRTAEFLPRTDGWIFGDRMAAMLDQNTADTLAQIYAQEVLTDNDWANAYDALANFLAEPSSDFQKKLGFAARLLSTENMTPEFAAAAVDCALRAIESDAVLDERAFFDVGTIALVTSNANLINAMIRRVITVAQDDLRSVGSEIADIAHALGDPRRPSVPTLNLDVKDAHSIFTQLREGPAHDALSSQYGSVPTSLGAFLGRLIDLCGGLEHFSLSDFKDMGTRTEVVGALLQNSWLSVQYPELRTAHAVEAGNAVLSAENTPFQFVSVASWLEQRRELIADPEAHFATAEILLRGDGSRWYSDPQVNNAVFTSLELNVRAGQVSDDRIKAIMNVRGDWPRALSALVAGTSEPEVKKAMVKEYALGSSSTLEIAMLSNECINLCLEISREGTIHRLVHNCEEKYRSLANACSVPDAFTDDEIRGLMGAIEPLRRPRELGDLLKHGLAEDKPESHQRRILDLVWAMAQTQPVKVSGYHESVIASVGLGLDFDKSVELIVRAHPDFSRLIEIIDDLSLRQLGVDGTDKMLEVLPKFGWSAESVAQLKDELALNNLVLRNHWDVS